MKKGYESPELEITKFNLSMDVLGISQDESGSSGGFINDPDDELIEELP